MPKLRIKGEMLELAKHIIATKKGVFDPAEFDDRYEAALAELVKAKIEGKALPKRKEVRVSKPENLLTALRESARTMADGQRQRAAANANRGTAPSTRRAPAAAGRAQQRKAS